MLAVRRGARKTARVHARLLASALALAACAPASAAPSPAQLLRTYAPIVVLHPDERFAPVPVESFLAASALEQRGADGVWQTVDAATLPVAGGPWRLDQRACTPRIGVASVACYAAAAGGPPTVYARHARTRDRIVLQYWLFSANDFWSGNHPPDDHVWQAHEGDWEAITILLSRTGRPLLAGYSQHCSGKRRAWARVPKESTHPLVHVALGSHSNWFDPGDHAIDTRCYPQAARAVFAAYLPAALDRTGAGSRLRPRVVRVDERSPGWMRFPGFWGEDGFFHWPGNTVTFEHGPTGPAFHGVWRDPVRTVSGYPAG
jgi:hypothetical protein